MVAEDEIIIGLIREFLGKPRYDGASLPQYEFNCKEPKCRGDNKYNLSYNSGRRIFQCWKCGYFGSVFRLVRDYGTAIQYDKLKLILPFNENFNNVIKKQQVAYDLITCELPAEYKPLTQKNNSWAYKKAMEYLIDKRKVDLKIIQKYNIGYTDSGDRKYRIIIPSYNNKGKVNYFEARTFLENVKKTYMKPENPDKNDIIFNESNINWDLPVYLVEGVFDMFRIPNAIPLLGKSPSEYLKSMLIKHNSKIIICLDEDAVNDSYEFYNELNSLGLDVYFIDMSGKGDLSELYEKFGQESITEILKSVKKIEFDSYIEKILKF